MNSEFCRIIELPNYEQFLLVKSQNIDKGKRVFLVHIYINPPGKLKLKIPGLMMFRVEFDSEQKMNSYFNGVTVTAALDMIAQVLKGTEVSPIVLPASRIIT